MVFGISAILLVLGASPLERPNSLMLDIGIGSVVGELGFTYARQLATHFQFEFGGGVGFFTGGQISLMPKLVFSTNEHWRYVPGIGVSYATGGIQAVDPATNTLLPKEDRIFWLNADALAFEFVDDNGFTVLLAAGTTTSLSQGTTGYVAPFGHEGAYLRTFGMTMPQVRVGLGGSF